MCLCKFLEKDTVSLLESASDLPFIKDDVYFSHVKCPTCKTRNIKVTGEGLRVSDRSFSAMLGEAKISCPLCINHATTFSGTGFEVATHMFNTCPARKIACPFQKTPHAISDQGDICPGIIVGGFGAMGAEAPLTCHEKQKAAIIDHQHECPILFKCQWSSHACTEELPLHQMVLHDDEHRKLHRNRRLIRDNMEVLKSIFTFENRAAAEEIGNQIQLILDARKAEKERLRAQREIERRQERARDIPAIVVALPPFPAERAEGQPEVGDEWAQFSY